MMLPYNSYHRPRRSLANAALLGVLALAYAVIFANSAAAREPAPVIDASAQPAASELEARLEKIERRLDSADFYEHLTDVLDEWSGDDVDELFELLETQLSEVGLDLKFEQKATDEDDEEEEDEEGFEEDEDPLPEDDEEEDD